ncbi:MAG TPA: DUF5996 family protein [Anaerolineae bacterium]|nr:DUF5996 family protein [Anaerolineae bacterium]
MTKMAFPPLNLVMWQGTRDMLNGYAKVVGKVRQALAPAQKHWWHVSLHVGGTGLVTPPMPCEGGSVAITLDLVRDEVRAERSDGAVWGRPLRGQTVGQFYDELMGGLAGMGVTAEVERKQFDAWRTSEYDGAAATNYWNALVAVDQVMKRFKGEQRRETSPVQLWPHHFDLAMLWLSGRLIAGQDTEDAEYSDEQMNFGFATGDGSVAEAYFYVTAYPLPEGWLGSALPSGAYWLEEGFKGAVLPYSAVVKAEDGEGLLLSFLRTTLKSGSVLMQGEVT